MGLGDDRERCDNEEDDNNKAVIEIMPSDVSM